MSRLRRNYVSLKMKQLTFTTTFSLISFAFIALMNEQAFDATRTMSSAMPTERPSVAVKVGGQYVYKADYLKATIENRIRQRFPITPAYLSANIVISCEITNFTNTVDVSIYDQMDKKTREGHACLIGATVSFQEKRSNKKLVKDIFEKHGTKFLGTMLSEDEAYSGACEKLAGTIYDTLIEFYSFEAEILSKSKDYVQISAGKNAGLSPNSRFSVFSNGLEVGSVSITAVYDRYSKAYIRSGNISIQVGNIVREKKGIDEKLEYLPSIKDHPVTDYKPIVKLPSSNWPGSVAFLQSNQILVGDFNNLEFRNISSGALDERLTNHTKNVSAVAISHDGRFVIVSGLDGKTIAWEIEKAKLSGVVDLGPAGITAIHVDPSNRYVAVIDISGNLKILSLPSLTFEKSFLGARQKLNSVVFSANGSTVIAAGDEKKIFIWDFASEKLIRTLKGHQGSIRGLTCSPKSDILYSCDEIGDLAMWDVSSGKELKRIKAHSAPIHSLALSQDGKILYSAGAGGAVKLWDVDASKLSLITSAGIGQEIYALAISSDDRYMGCAVEDGTTIVYDLEQIPMISEKRALPAELELSLNFDDRNSFYPNNILQGGENSNFIVKIQNKGKGTAYGVNLHFDGNDPKVTFKDSLYIGDIISEEIREVTLSMSADLNIEDGYLNLGVIAKEKRGYDARPIQLQIPVRHLDKPALEIASQQINDRKSGLADGNGNGIPENNETIELIVFVKNSGVGEALGVNLNLAATTSGVEKVQESFSIGNIEPQQTKEGKIVFRIPRTFNAAQIDYEITAEDKIGASRVSRKFSEALSRRVPILAYDYRILNAQGAPVDRIHNGGSFVLEITPRNNGAIEANGVNLQLVAPTGITLASSSQLVGHLAQNAAATPIRFAFTVPRSFASPNAAFRIDLSQTDFSGKQDNISVPLTLKQPNLSETHQVVETNRNGVIEQGENVELSFQILNTGDLEAENVRVTLDIANSSVDFRDREKLVGTILPGRGETVKFNFFVKFSTTPGPLPLSLKITQADFPNVSKSITEYAIKEVGAQVVTITGEEQKRVAPAAAPRSVNAAPVIIIGAPRDGDTIYEDRVSLVGSVTDDRAINAIEIRLNGQIVPEVERGVALTQKPQTVDPKQRAFDRALALQSGPNIISVIAYDTDNAREEKTITVTRAREQSEIWAVVIGIANYPKVPPLEYSIKDALAFRDYLTQNFGIAPDHIETLINEQATTQQFRKMLGTELRRKVRKQDMVIIYYAGHGAPEPDTESPDGDGLEKYILPFDADPNDLYSTGIRMTEIADIFQRLSAERLVFIADACYSGASGGRTILSGRRANLSPAFLDRIAQGKGRVILTASDANEVSVEGKNFGGGHGAFTFHLLEGLRGKADYDQNGDITVDEAFQYVSKTVPSATGQKQHPMKKGEMVGQMILGRVR